MNIFKKKTKYELFWEWFSDQEEFINSNLEVNTTEIATLVNQKLQEVHPGLAFEIPFELVNRKRQLIISADGIEAVFPEVTNMYDVAPDLDDWEIFAFRQRYDTVNYTVEVDGLLLSYSDVYFQYDLTDLPLDIDVYIRGYDNEDNRYVHAFFLLLDGLVGEFDAVMQFGEIVPHALEEDMIEDKDLLEMPKLRDLIDELSVAN